MDRTWSGFVCLLGIVIASLAFDFDNQHFARIFCGITWSVVAIGKYAELRRN